MALLIPVPLRRSFDDVRFMTVIGVVWLRASDLQGRHECANCNIDSVSRGTRCTRIMFA